MKLLKLSAITYVVILLTTIVFGVFFFGDLYEAAAPVPGATFSQPYQVFLIVVGGMLAITLAGLCHLIGKAFGKFWLSSVSLLIGIGMTAVSLSVLPWNQFPYDQYAVGAGWLMFWGPVSVGLWLLISSVALIKKKSLIPEF